MAASTASLLHTTDDVSSECGSVLSILNRPHPKHPLVRLAHYLWNDCGALMIALAAAIFSISTLSVKLLGTSIVVNQIVFTSSVFSWVITSIMVLTSRSQLIHPSQGIRALTLLRSLLGAAALTLFFSAVETMEMRDAVTLFFCSPVVVALMEWLVQGEGVSMSAVIGCFVSVAGVVFITQPTCVSCHLWASSSAASIAAFSTPLQAPSVSGIILATTGAIANASSFVTMRQIKNAQSAVVTTWWYHSALIVVSGSAMALRVPAPPSWPGQDEWVLLLIICFCQFSAQILLNRGFQLLQATRGSAINVLQVLCSFIWDSTLLGHEPSFESLLGGALVMAGVVLVTLKAPKTVPPVVDMTPRRSLENELMESRSIEEAVLLEVVLDKGVEEKRRSFQERLRE